MREPLEKLTPPERAPKLKELADACNQGACNTYALACALRDAVGELKVGEVKDHPAFKVILGQLSYLCAESAGPTTEAIADYERWAASKPTSNLQPATEYNLDAMTPEELEWFVKAIGGSTTPVNSAKLLFPDRDAWNGETIAAVLLLRDYAITKAAAMRARVSGNIPEALTLEGRCDELYQSMPKWARGW